jgi:hypothetical protein
MTYYCNFKMHSYHYCLHFQRIAGKALHHTPQHGAKSITDTETNRKLTLIMNRLYKLAQGEDVAGAILKQSTFPSFSQYLADHCILFGLSRVSRLGKREGSSDVTTYWNKPRTGMIRKLVMSSWLGRDLLHLGPSKAPLATNLPSCNRGRCERKEYMCS